MHPLPSPNSAFTLMTLSGDLWDKSTTVSTVDFTNDLLISFSADHSYIKIITTAAIKAAIPTKRFSTNARSEGSELLYRHPYSKYHAARGNAVLKMPTTHNEIISKTFLGDDCTRTFSLIISYNVSPDT